MKKLVFILLAICLTGIACEKKKETDSGCGKLEINEEEYITMQILPKEVSANSKDTIRFENHTKQEMYADYSFSLEYFDKNCWTPVELENQIDPLIRHICKAGATSNMGGYLYLLIERYDLKKGRYKIIKEVSLQNVGKYNICAEFEIK